MRECWGACGKHRRLSAHGTSLLRVLSREWLIMASRELLFRVSLVARTPWLFALRDFPNGVLRFSCVFLDAISSLRTSLPVPPWVSI